MDRQAYAGETLPYRGTKVLVIDQHTTPDIIDEIKAAHKDYAGDYDKIAEEFWQGDVKSTASNLFNVLKKHVIYDVEHPDNQQVKSPGAIFHQKHGDCKHYASVAVGVANALQRKGHNIHAKYRFVADCPGEPVHHVFAVLSDGKNDYWVDPVLSTFNDQPKFHNIKDVDMAVYRVSGLGPDGRPENLPLVGKNNIFKKLAHAVQVNTSNAAHAIQVNTANAGKGIKQAAHDVAKGAENTVKEVKHVALNVGLSPARNAFLALLDINGFNLATRMSDAWTNHKDEVVKEWKKLGGDEKKLLAAINNGRKHKAFYHDQAPATRLSGTDGGPMEDFLKNAPNQPNYRRKHMVMVPCLMDAYDIGPDDYGRLPKVSGIGEPVSIVTLSALASAIIAVMSKFMKPDHGDQNAADAAQAGVANIIQNASDASDLGQNNTASQLMDIANKGAQAVNTMKVAAGMGPDGTPTVAITDFQHPQLNNAGTNSPTSPAQYGGGSSMPSNYQDPNTTLADKVTELPGSLVENASGDIASYVREIWHDYKTPILLGGLGIIAYTFVGKSKKNKHLAPIIILGVGGVVTYVVVTKKKFPQQQRQLAY